jgi:RNA polymerase sigma-70 factor (ECF subfamily)
MRRTHEDILDELLVLQCQEGDAAALRKLVGRWHPRLTRLAWRLTAEREVVRDIVQDAWLAIVKGLNRLDDPSRFRTWAYRIVRNKCADWSRRGAAGRNAAKELRGVAATAALSNNAGPAGELSEVRRALAGLPAEQRAMLSLHYLDGIGLSEVARVLGVPKGTVKSRLFHARARLRDSLERMKS